MAQVYVWPSSEIDSMHSKRKDNAIGAIVVVFCCSTANGCHDCHVVSEEMDMFASKHLPQVADAITTGTSSLDEMSTSSQLSSHLIWNHPSYLHWKKSGIS